MTISHIYLIKTHSESLYEIQVNDNGSSRCRKNTERWKNVKAESPEYLDDLTIGPSFNVPGVVLTSMVKDYQHFVPSGEPKRTTTEGFFGGMAQHVIHQIQGPVEPVIVSVEIGPATGSYGTATATAVFDDGSTDEVVSWYDDEITFTDAELIGLTRKSARELFHKKDIAYIKAP